MKINKKLPFYLVAFFLLFYILIKNDGHIFIKVFTFIFHLPCIIKAGELKYGFEGYYCVEKFKDAGKECTRSSDCLSGFCQYHIENKIGTCTETKDYYTNCIKVRIEDKDIKRSFTNKDGSNGIILPCASQ